MRSSQPPDDELAHMHASTALTAMTLADLNW